MSTVHKVSVAISSSELSLAKGGSFKLATSPTAMKGAEAVQTVLTANLEFANSPPPSLGSNSILMKDDASAEHHKKAMRFFDDRKFEDAHHHFRLALKADPENAPALSDWGVLHWFQQNIGKAQDCFERALLLNANHAGSRFNLGLVHYHNCDLELAKQQFQKCLEVNPNHASARQHLSEVVLLESESDIAQRRSTVGQDSMKREMPLTLRPDGESRSASTSASHSPADSETPSRSESPSVLDESEEAEARAAARSVQHHKRGMKLFSNNQAAQALQEFCLAIELDPSNAPAISDKGVLHFFLGEHETAELCFGEALALKPAHAGSHFNLALILRGRGELAEAKGHLERCLAANPQHAPALQHLAELSRAVQQPQPQVAVPPAPPRKPQAGLPRLQPRAPAQPIA